MEPKSFVVKPILFGDFHKMGTNPEDRMYEEFMDLKKLQNLLQDVSYKTFYIFCFFILLLTVHTSCPRHTPQQSGLSV